MTKHSRPIDFGVIPERVLNLIAAEPNDGCWLWQGVTTVDGYAHYYYGGRRFLLHRKTYESHVGPIPEGLQIDHLCRVRNCVNPKHLEPVTADENKRRGGLAVTHCAHGHEYTAANTRINGRWRGCKACDRIRARARRAGVTPNYGG